MHDDLFYWIFSLVIVAAVFITSGRSKSQAPRIFFGGALLLAMASIGIGFIFDRTLPQDVLLLRVNADIFSIFLVSVAYGMVVRAVVSAMQRQRRSSATTSSSR